MAEKKGQDEGMKKNEEWRRQKEERANEEEKMNFVTIEPIQPMEG